MEEEIRVEPIKQKKEPKIHWLDLFLLACIIFGAVVISVYLITEKMYNCTSDPLKYLVEKIQTDGNVSYPYIKLYLFLDKNDEVPSEILELNLKNGKND